jgi:peptidyl-prolyl cis-trans isomerase D
MLSFFRRGGTGQVIIGAVVFAVIIVFVMEFRPGRQGGAGISRSCAVKVVDRCIDRKEYFAAYQLIVPRGFPNKKVRELGLKKVVMQGLVERELLDREAERLGIGVSEETLDDELSAGRARVSIPIAQLGMLAYSLGLNQDMIRLLPVKSAQSDEFDYKIYERVVRNTTNRSPKEFKDMQRREMIAQRMRDLVRSRVRVSETEAYSVWERERSKAVARVVEAKIEWFAKWVVDSSDEAVADWTLKNDKALTEAWTQAQAGWHADCQLGSEIMVNVDEDAGDVTKADQRKKIDDALERVKKGEPFEQVAKSVSEGGTAGLGGYLGCISETYGPGAKELDEQLAKMKPGEVSSVVETKRGFHLVKSAGKLAAADVEKIGKRAVARRLAVQAKATELAKQFSDDLIEKTKGDEKLDDAVKALGTEYALRHAGAKAPSPGKTGSLPALDDPSRPKMEVTAPFNVTSSPVEDASPGQAPAAKVFELEKPDQVVAKPVRTASGFAVLQLKEKDLAKKEDFAKDRVSVLRTLRQAKEVDAVGRYVSALRSSVKEQITFDTRLLEDNAADDSGDG